MNQSAEIEALALMLRAVIDAHPTREVALEALDQLIAEAHASHDGPGGNWPDPLLSAMEMHRLRLDRRL